MFEIMDLLILILLGLLGWALFAPLRIPAPALLGTIAVVGTLRILGYPLPMAPEFLSPAVQVFLGLFVGSKVTPGTTRQLRAMLPPAFMVVLWALGLVFGLGYFLSRITYLDPVTAILSSSVGGLPEMTVIALDTDADLPAVISIILVRMLATVFTFPLIIKILKKEDEAHNDDPFLNKNEEKKVEVKEDHAGGSDVCHKLHKIFNIKIRSLINSARWVVISLAIAAAGGVLFINLGVPAGGMVGSMFFVATASLLGVPIVTPTIRVLGFMLLGVGLMVADNFTPETAETFLTGEIILPMTISIVLVFISSICVANLIHKVAGWDLTTSLLAAAPGGFTIMTTLAIKYNKDPLRVSILHLCRLLAIKSVVPFVFMFF